MRILVLGAAMALTACKTPVVMTKPGVNEAQAAKDKSECEARANKSVQGRIWRPGDDVKAYNRNLLACMRERGYEVEGD